MQQSLTGRFSSWRGAAAPPMLECVPFLTQPRPGVRHARPAQAPLPRPADRRLVGGKEAARNHRTWILDLLIRRHSQHVLSREPQDNPVYLFS
jgi:hypothetical protein